MMESRGQLTLQLIFILEHLSCEGKAERVGGVQSGESSRETLQNLLGPKEIKDVFHLCFL